MTAPLVAYRAIAGQRDFDVPFPYINSSHVEVRVNSNSVPILEWVSQSRLRLSVPPGADAYVEIRRNTPIDDALVDFQNGAVLTEEDLNTAILQLLYKQQEVTALYDASLVAAQVRLAAANGIPVSPEDVANQLANLVLEDQVLASFQQRINDIDANSDAIALTSQDIIDLSTSITGEIGALAAQITDPTNGNVRLKTLLDTLRADHTTLSGVVDGLLSLGNGEGIASIIQQEADARISGDEALAALISLIGAKSGDNSSFILDLAKVKVSPLESLATRLSTISSNTAANAAAITNEANTRTTAIAAEATQRNALNTSLTNAINNEASTRAAAILSEQTARSTALAAEATARTQLGATLTGLINGEATSRAAAITTEQQARISGDAAEANQRQLLGASLTTAIEDETTAREAAILTEQNARVTAIASEAAARQSLGASLTTAINNEATTRAAAIQSEQTARANAITAEAQARNTLAATLRSESDADIAAADTQIRTDVTAQIQAETNARVTALSAEATARNLVRSDLTTMINGETSARTAAITSEANTRASADSVFAGNFTLLGAKNAGSTAFVLNESTVQVAGGVSLGTRLSGIDTSVGNVSAAVANEQTARSTADSALSTSINTVSTNVGNLSATVSTLSSSLNGVSAKYGVSLNVNGHITGFVQNNNGTTGDFLILADKFAIVDPNNGNPFTPFEVSGGVVRIKDAQIGTLTVGKLSSGTLNADMNVGSGRIVFDNGVSMKVQGVGFGTANQFIEWFGPKRAINTCSEANATYYLKMDGSAYFGGSLSAGILKNAYQTSDLSTNASITTPAFGSNGGTINVVLSYYWSATLSKTYAATTTGRNQWNADVATFGGSGSPDSFSGTIANGGTVDVALSRSVNGGGLTQVTTLTINGGTISFDGTAPVVGDSPGSAVFTQVFGGSLTYTDPASLAQDRIFSASITNNTINRYLANQQQRLGIVATE
jgi:hypothetical protein